MFTGEYQRDLCGRRRAEAAVGEIHPARQSAREDETDHE